MANDPHRDLLPVREDGSRNGRGFSDKFDYQILGKLSRCELEDRFLRLLDEQTHIKKLANSQEEKIKRLGTKLLRLISEKKNGRRFNEHTKETEDLHLRIIELEHENYTLKDKNTVLKQQLSTHSRHLFNHRSPVRSTHTSPLMTTRQSAPPVHSECAYETSNNKNGALDMQLQEAEAHINELNEEIKGLHNKIQFLEQNLQKNNLDNIKIKVSENIELIRLQRSLKQQAIQIASLQEQVKNSEKSQQVLRKELAKAHSENDEALQLITLKQNEIICLCSKLEEKNLNRLEENELKERIRDLMIERDCLKERSEFLMKSIVTKTEETEKIKELQKLLEEEKCKKEKLEIALQLADNSKTVLPLVHSSPSSIHLVAECSVMENTSEKKIMVSSGCNVPDESEPSSSQRCSLNYESYSDTESSECQAGKELMKRRRSTPGKCTVDKMKLELELQYLREMLRSQTSRCEAQQAEITRLMYELKLNESKCSETLQKLDCHLRIFETLEMRALPIEGTVTKTPERLEKKPEEPVQISKISVEKEEKVTNDRFHPSNTGSSLITLRRVNPDTSTSIDNKKEFGFRRKESSSEDNIPSKLVASETATKAEIPTEHKRFVEQTFLDSSDDEYGMAAHLEKEPFLKSLEQIRDSNRTRKRSVKSDNISRFQSSKNSKSKGEYLRDEPMKNTSDYYSKPYSSGVSTRDATKHFGKTAHSDNSKTVSVTILWFKIKQDSSLWRNENIEMLFIDFSFLDFNGVETETPESVAKPSHPDTTCEFNFTKSIVIQDDKVSLLQQLLRNPDSTLFEFKVVSDSEKFDETNEECEDVGAAVVTSRVFLEYCNKNPFHAKVFSPENPKEIVGTLAVSFEASSKLLNIMS